MRVQFPPALMLSQIHNTDVEDTQITTLLNKIMEHIKIMDKSAPRLDDQASYRIVNKQNIDSISVMINKFKRHRYPYKVKTTA